MTALDDLEARVAALEASQADYRAVLSAVNALGVNQRELAEGHRQLRADVADIKTDIAGVNALVRSIEDGQAEMKDLLIRALDT